MINTLFAAASAPATFEWSPKCALVMISCNILAYAIARATIRKPNEGFAMPNARFFGFLIVALAIAYASILQVIITRAHFGDHSNVAGAEAAANKVLIMINF